VSRHRSTPEPQREERDSDSGPGSLADVRVRVKPRDVHAIIRSVFGVSAIVFWGLGGVGFLRFAPVAVSSLADLTQAMTRASVALEHASEGTARIEAATTRMEGKLDALLREQERCTRAR